MAHVSVRRFAGVLGLLLTVALPNVVSSQGATPVFELPEGVEVIAAGLTNPRGFTWGADGQLFIGLAGNGGDTQLEAEGTPLPFLVGPTSSVATLENGCAVPVAEGIGSALWTDAGWIWGAMDVAVLDGELYVLAGAGTGLGGNGIYRVLADGGLELVADLGAWMTENPTAFIPPDYDPTGSWFDLEAGTDRLWISEAVGGQIVTVTPAGEITRVVDLSDGHMVPTGIVLDGEGGVYVGFETTAPYPDGGSKVVHVAADATVSDYWTGLTAVTDLVMGPDGMLYAAEMATGNTDEAPFLTPNSGRVVRMTGPDSLEPVLTDVDAPVYLGFGDDGALYVSLPAFSADAGVGHGAVLRTDLAVGLPISLAGVTNLPATCSSGATPAA
jgi:hypothetical protein